MVKKYKSKFEGEVSKVLGKRAKYESTKIHFTQPAVERIYMPDWQIGENTFIETKGKLDLDTRKKMLWVIEQHPDKKFYMLFQNAHNRITKRSNTTYADWCDKNNIEWAHYPDGIPDHWFGTEINADQPSNRKRKRKC